MPNRSVEVFYDGWCPMCRAIRARIERFDWLGMVQFTSIREGGVAEQLGVSPEQLERRMHVRYVRTGQVVAGIHAVAAVTARVPLFTPLWPFVALSGRLGLGQPLYDWIASRRAVVPVGQCHDGVCEVHFTKKG